MTFLTINLEGDEGAVLSLAGKAKMFADLGPVFKKIREYQIEGHEGGVVHPQWSTRWKSLHTHNIRITPLEMTTETHVKFKMKRPLRVVTIAGEIHHREVFEAWVMEVANG